jgi:hypothetical protein
MTEESLLQRMRGSSRFTLGSSSWPSRWENLRSRPVEEAFVDRKGHQLEDLKDQAVSPSGPQDPNVGLKAPQGKEGLRETYITYFWSQRSFLQSRGEAVVGSVTSVYERGVTGLRIVSWLQVHRPQKEEKEVLR